MSDLKCTVVFMLCRTLKNKKGAKNFKKNSNIIVNSYHFFCQRANHQRQLASWRQCQF